MQTWSQTVSALGGGGGDCLHSDMHEIRSIIRKYGSNFYIGIAMAILAYFVPFLIYKIFHLI